MKRTLFKSLLMTAVAALIAGCAVGPDYVRPSAPVPAAYKEIEGWKPAQPQDDKIRGKWWELFNDPDLNALEEQVNISNQNIVQAEAQYREALAQVKIYRAGFFPGVSAGASYERLRGSSNISQTTARQSTISNYLLTSSMSWELDVWGRVRRQVEAGTASARASAADMESIRLSSQAQLAQDYFQLRILDARKQLLEATIVAYRKSLELTQNRYAAGVASRADVLQAETQLKTSETQAIDVELERAQLEHAIALLCGKAASDFSIPVAPISVSMPAIPVGLPSQLLERRPDVASAERQMAAANALIGVAVAGFFPNITLNASGGYESAGFSNWLKWPSRFWAVGPAVSQTLFQGGLSIYQTEQARAAYDAAVAAYRQTVLNAFREVEDYLAALRILERESRAQMEAVDAAHRSEAAVVNQYKQGVASYLNVVSAQSASLTNDRAALDILNRQMAAAVQLIKALGGGWDASKPGRDKK
jgi:NodT family efflux transporter outer membrane factor (OMF) lipoprotein